MIIGLIIAGVTAGSSLVHTSHLRSIITNEQMYVSAENAFKMQYNGLAGDIPNATSYWPANAINGSGDNKMAHIEGVQGWHQLQVTKLISNGNYNGLYGRPGVVGVTWGVSGYSSTVGFNMFTSGGCCNTGWVYGSNAVYGRTVTVFSLGGIDTFNNNYAVSSAALTPNDAYGIDMKLDDGLPNTGSVMSDNGYDTGITTCTNGNQALASNIAAGVSVSYLNNNTVGCRMMFVYK